MKTYTYKNVDGKHIVYENGTAIEVCRSQSTAYLNVCRFFETYFLLSFNEAQDKAIDIFTGEPVEMVWE
jgi:hypothetical protein